MASASERPCLSACLFLILAALVITPVRGDVFETRVSTTADDAEESLAGGVSTTSSDLEMTLDGSTQQVVGLRFSAVTVPPKAQILAAWVQFSVDETGSDAAVLMIRGEAADQAALFAETTRNISSRIATLAAVSWSPGAWSSTGAAGTAQRTSDLARILQEIVDRPGWKAGNPVALTISGSGHRVAVARDGSSSAAPLLHVEYTAVKNRAPSVSVLNDFTIVLPSAATLTGTVSDDGLPAGSRLTTRWMQASGPAAASLTGVSTLQASAAFPRAGTYSFMLTAGDGELSSYDSVTVTVQAPSIPTNLAPQGTIMAPAGAVTVVAGIPVQFLGMAVDGDGHLPLYYAWDFGGGAPSRRTKDPGPVIFTTPGVYTVRLAVTDRLGVVDPTPDTRVITVVQAAGSTTYHVSPSGSDSQDGSLTRPLRTIARGLSLLKPGDRLLLRQGTYRERLTVDADGTSTAPIIIQAWPGEKVVVDNALAAFRAAGNTDWEPFNTAIGEYRTVASQPSGTPRGYITGITGYENERVGLVSYASSSAFRSTSTTYVDSSTPFYVGPGVYQESDGRIHIRLSKTPEMREMESRYGQVLAAENDDPRRYGMVLTTTSSTVTVRGSWLVIKDITFQLGTHTVQLNEDVHHVTFDAVTIWSGDTAVANFGSGVHDITIVNSRLYGDVPRWIAWSDAKNSPAPADRMRGTMVDLQDGAKNVTVAYSHVRGGHDGIGMNEDEDGLVVHHSRIENFADDAFELEGSSVGRIEIYDNYIANCLVAIAPGQSSDSFGGPLLAYRNIIAQLRQPLVNRKEDINDWNGGGRFGIEYMFKHGSVSRNIHYYQNTLLLVGSGAGLGLSITPRDVQDARIANNLMMTVNGVVNRDFRTGSGLVLDGDLYWKMNTVDSARLLASYDTVSAFSSSYGLETHGLGAVSKRGTDPRFLNLNLRIVDRTASTWQLGAAGELQSPESFLLAADSPAISAGIVIPAHPVLGTLPDTRKSRDIGAIPWGTNGAEFRIFPFLPSAPNVAGAVGSPEEDAPAQ